MISRSGKTILNKLEKRIIDISFKHKLSHIGSCLLASRIIDHIYLVKRPQDIFILSSGHSGVALYTILEKFENKDAEKLFLKHGVHPNRDVGDGIHASSGSLGHGIGIAVGMALAHKDKDIYVLVTDGEMAEGSCWEALRIASELRLENLRITCLANGYGAYGKIDNEVLDMRMQLFYPSLVQRLDMYEAPDFLQGQDAHYKILSEDEYKTLTS